MRSKPISILWSLIAAAAALVPTGVRAADTLLITEFMAVNNSTLADEDGAYSDWIEIYNAGVNAVDALGWYLTDTRANLVKWRFPSTNLPPSGFLVVFASGKNRVTPGSPLHTSFSLGSSGEYLALVKPDGLTVASEFAPTYPPQTNDIAYGYTMVGGLVQTNSSVFMVPTPGATNSTGGVGFAPEVHFSLSSRTFLTGTTFPLDLTTPGVTNATIYYALGTNLPGANTIRYINPIIVSTTIVVRARCFVPGKLPGEVKTMSYIGLSPANAGLAYMTNVVTFNADLPLMILHNSGQGTVRASGPEQHVTWQVFENDFGRSSLTNLPSQTGRGMFHAGGSSTLISSAGKASFRLDTRDELDNDYDVPLLGFPKQSDWVLYAPNNFEPALMHNPLAHAWYRDLGRYGSRTRFVEVFLQDDATPGSSIAPADYMGIYVLEEKIKRDPNRVAIARLDTGDVTLPSITGGYLLSIDRAAAGQPQFNAGGATLNWVEPNGDDMANALRHPQRAYIIDYLNTFNSVLTGANWTNALTGYAAYIDIDSWIDFHIHEVITFNVDSLRLSGYFFKDRNKKIEYGPTWDYDRTQGSTDGRDANPRVWASSVSTDFFNFTPWWGRLFHAPDFWQAWIDRYQEMREGTNVLTTNNINAHIQRFYDQLVEAQPRELARWAIQPRGAGGFGAGTFATEIQWKRNWYSNRCDYADNQFLAKPSFSLPPGQFSNSFSVTITPVTGLGDRPADSQLLVSLDGSDPRLSGGGIATGQNILSNTGPITVTVSNTVRLFARSRNPAHANAIGSLNPPISSPWSGPLTGTYYFNDQTPPFRVTEIMYHPAKLGGDGTNDGNNFEYVEFKNISTAPLNITGYRLRGGIEFDFPALALAAGQSCVVVANLTGFQSRYGTNNPSILIAGSYTNNPAHNRLGNSGDHLKLEGFYQEPILDFSYSSAWYPITDGAGLALQIVNENGAIDTWGLKSSWRPSGTLYGSPGTHDPGAVVVAPILVNEVLSHATPPWLDAIELYNPNAVAVDIGGWYLSDDLTQPKKFRFPEAVLIEPGGFFALDETAFNPFSIPPSPGSFSFQADGDEIYLFSADAVGELTGYAHGFKFGAAEANVAFGRHVTSVGEEHFVAQRGITMSATNDGPRVGPLVISEIMFHPRDISTVEGIRDNDRDEYIELHNVTDEPLPLLVPSNAVGTWCLRQAVEFDFPTHLTIPPRGYLVAVGFNPHTDTAQVARLRTRYFVTDGVVLVGPWQGKLSNTGGTIDLCKPFLSGQAAASRSAVRITVDQVRYSNSVPWSVGADGLGFSLHRLVVTDYGNDPTNWTSALPTPGYSDATGNGPVFTQQPQNIAVLGTLPAMFSVTATGSPPIYYQWIFGNNGIPDATNTVYMIPSVTTAHAGSYRCLAQNSGAVTFSTAATLTYLRPAYIVTQPLPTEARAGTNAATASNVTFSVTADSPRPISYQWRFNSTNIPWGTSRLLTVTNVQAPDDGLYSVVCTDAISSVTSDSVRLTVLINPYFIQVPVNQTAVVGDNVTFSVIVGGTQPFGYRWRKSASTIVGQVTNFLTITNVTLAMHSNALNSFEVIVTNKALPGGVISSGNVVANRAFILIATDADNDRLPDDWETANGLNPIDPNDAAADPDMDGFSNLAEYLAGTDPRDANSYLRIALSAVPGTATVQFAAVSNRTYTVQHTDTLPAAAPWTKLADFPARATNRVEFLSDLAWTTNRFYRVVTPRSP